MNANKANWAVVSLAEIKKQFAAAKKKAMASGLKPGKDCYNIGISSDHEVEVVWTGEENI